MTNPIFKQHFAYCCILSWTELTNTNTRVTHNHECLTVASRLQHFDCWGAGFQNLRLQIVHFRAQLGQNMTFSVVGPLDRGTPTAPPLDRPLSDIISLIGMPQYKMFI